LNHGSYAGSSVPTVNLPGVAKASDPLAQVSAAEVVAAPPALVVVPAPLPDDELPQAVRAASRTADPATAAKREREMRDMTE